MFSFYLYRPTQADFEDACENGKLRNAMKILSANSNIKVSEYIFNCVCEKGYLEIAQWLYSIHPITPIDIPFILALSNGHLPVAKWLFSFTPMTPYMICNAFNFACMNEQLEIAKWLHSVNERIIVIMNIQKLFDMACIYDNLELAQWLHSIRPAEELENAFHWACINGNLQMAQWLYTLHPEVKIQFSKKYCYYRNRHYRNRPCSNISNTKMEEVNEWLSKCELQRVTVQPHDIPTP